VNLAKRGRRGLQLTRRAFSPLLSRDSHRRVLDDDRRKLFRVHRVSAPRITLKFCVSTHEKGHGGDGGQRADYGVSLISCQPRCGGSANVAKLPGLFAEAVAYFVEQKPRPRAEVSGKEKAAAAIAEKFFYRVLEELKWLIP
jgi:hypothetical protein